MVTATAREVNGEFSVAVRKGVHPRVEMTHVVSLKFRGGGNT